MVSDARALRSIIMPWMLGRVPVPKLELHFSADAGDQCGDALRINSLFTRHDERGQRDKRECKPDQRLRLAQETDRNAR